MLAYSGGLDTSVAVRWMTEEMSVEVIALAVDVGQGGDWEAIKARAVAAGAVEVEVVDAGRSSLGDFVAPAIKANALYEGKYPLISSLSRPVIVKHLVDARARHRRRRRRPRVHGQGQRPGPLRGLDARPGPRPGGPGAGAHLGHDPRGQSIEYAATLGDPDQRHQGEPVLASTRTSGAGPSSAAILEDPWVQPPEDVYELTVPNAAAEQHSRLVISFEGGAARGARRRRWPSPTLIGAG